MKSSKVEMLKNLKSKFDCLRVGQSIYVSAAKFSSARVVAVGRKWIHVSGGRKIEAREVIDWWSE